MSIKKEIKNKIGYKLSVGETTLKKLVKLYKKDPEYVNRFLKEIETLNYGDEERRRKINNILTKESSGKGCSICISKPEKITDKFKRYKIRVTIRPWYD